MGVDIGIFYSSEIDEENPSDEYLGYHRIQCRNTHFMDILPPFLLEGLPFIGTVSGVA